MCVMSIPVLGSPGSTDSVTIPEPAVLGGLTASQVYYYEPPDSMTAILINTALQVSVPVRGSQTVDIRVVVILSSGAQQSCNIPVIVSGYYH